MKILVTGATGLLGSALLNQLSSPENKVKVTSRSKPVSTGPFEWVYSDLSTGEGIEEAVQGVDVIIHAATSPVKNSKIVEVSGFEEFLSKIQHINHFIYPSIVGIDEIPLKYYKLKHEAEDLLKNSSIPYTIVRATQFHNFVDNLFLSKPLFNRYVVPGNIKFQSIDVSEFANHLIGLVDKGPQGRTDDFGGPDILTLREMAELKIQMNNESNKVLSFSMPGQFYRSLKAGKNTNDKQRMGKITFKDYLKNKMV